MSSLNRDLNIHHIVKRSFSLPANPYPPTPSQLRSHRLLTNRRLFLNMTHGRIHPPLITLHQLTIQVLRKHIYLRVLKLPRADFLLKQHIHLCKRATRRFWDTEVSVNDTKEADTAPEEAGEVAPIPGTGVKHVGRENGADDTDDDAGGRLETEIRRHQWGRALTKACDREQ